MLDFTGTQSIHGALMISRFSAAVSSFAVLLLAGSAATAAEKEILIVLTNHSDLGDTGKKTGFFLSEASHPWEVFRKAGYTVKLASPDGGVSTLDIKSYDLKDPVNKEFWDANGSGTEEAGTLAVKETSALKDLKAGDFRGVFFAGGHGTMWDFRKSEEVTKFAAQVYDGGGTVGAVCHGPAALIEVKLSDGSPLVKGKSVAGFTNEEEIAVKLDKVVPYLLQTELEKAGARFVAGENFKENAVRDGRLVTGQNPASAKKAAELMVEALESK